MSNAIQVEVVLSHSEHLPVVDVWLVVDILRATTVMTRWFEAGGVTLYPAESTEGAKRLAERLRGGGETPVLMGEQNAIAPQGFDLGNSPLDITPELCKKYSCAVMATTNGTKALLKALSTGMPVLVASARNAMSALDLALSKGRRIGIFCSGRKGRPAWDDTLCAGLLTAALAEFSPEVHLADSARLALLTWQSSRDFLTSLKSADHAVFLGRIGFGEDIVFASETDVAHTVPELREVPDGEGLLPCLKEGLRAGTPSHASLRRVLPGNAAGPSLLEGSGRRHLAAISSFSDEDAEGAALSDGTDSGVSGSGVLDFGSFSPDGSQVFLGGENFRKHYRSKSKKI